MTRGTKQSKIAKKQNKKKMNKQQKRKVKPKLSKRQKRLNTWLAKWEKMKRGKHGWIWSADSEATLRVLEELPRAYNFERLKKKEQLDVLRRIESLRLNVPGLAQKVGVLGPESLIQALADKTLCRRLLKIMDLFMQDEPNGNFYSLRTVKWEKSNTSHLECSIQHESNYYIEDCSLLTDVFSKLIDYGKEKTATGAWPAQAWPHNPLKSVNELDLVQVNCAQEQMGGRITTSHRDCGEKNVTTNRHYVVCNSKERNRAVFMKPSFKGILNKQNRDDANWLADQLAKRGHAICVDLQGPQVYAFQDAARLMLFHTVLPAKGSRWSLVGRSMAYGKKSGLPRLPRKSLKLFRLTDVFPKKCWQRSEKEVKRIDRKFTKWSL